MTRRDIARSLRRFWPLSIAVLAIFIAIGIAASFLPTKQYQASALLYAQSTNAQAAISGDPEVPLILPVLVQQVGTQLFDNQVAAADPASALTSLSATNTAGTPVLTVTAQSTNPHTAATAANAAANELIAHPLSTLIKLSTVDPAFAPSSPSSPQKTPILIGCTVLGLILALFAALVADSLRKRVADAEMIRERFGLTVLGEITSNRRTKRPPAELFGEGGSREASEQYQRLRTNFGLLADLHHTVAVTSWTQGEGKTTVTANLGWMLASLGRRVTIVDLDLRRPSVHTHFGLEQAGGIGELSTGPLLRELLWARAKPAGLARLDVLTAGTVTDQPARVIEKVFPAITETLEDRLLLIDTPPLQVAETALVASMVDALVIVIDMRRREPAELEALLQILNVTNTTILGVVLNRVRHPSQTVAAYYYGPSSTPATPWGAFTDRVFRRRDTIETHRPKPRPSDEESVEGNHGSLDPEPLDSESIEPKRYTRAKKFQ